MQTHPLYTNRCYPATWLVTNSLSRPCRGSKHTLYPKTMSLNQGDCRTPNSPHCASETKQGHTKSLHEGKPKIQKTFAEQVKCTHTRWLLPGHGVKELLPNASWISKFISTERARPATVNCLFGLCSCQTWKTTVRLIAFSLHNTWTAAWKLSEKPKPIEGWIWSKGMCPHQL